MRREGSERFVNEAPVSNSRSELLFFIGYSLGVLAARAATERFVDWSTRNEITELFIGHAKGIERNRWPHLRDHECEIDATETFRTKLVATALKSDQGGQDYLNFVCGEQRLTTPSLLWTGAVLRLEKPWLRCPSSTNRSRHRA